MGFKVLILILVISLLSGCTGGAQPTDSTSPLPTPTATATPVPNTPELFVKSGDDALYRSDFAAAEDAYQQALKLNAGFAPAYSHQALLHMLVLDQWQGALEMAQKAVELAPEDGEAQAYLALVQGLQSHEKAMAETAQKAVALSDSSAMAHVALARAYLYQRELEKSESELQRALTLEPENVMALLTQVEWYSQQGQLDEALVAAEKAVAQAPDFAYARVILADAHSRVWEYAEAEAELKKVEALAPHYLPAALSRGWLYLRQDQRDQLLVALSGTGKLSKSIPEISLIWGWVHYDKESYPEARAEFQKALDADADFWPAYLGLGAVDMAEEACDKAVEQFHKAVDLHPYSGYAHARLSVALDCQEDPERAAEGFDWALKLSPYHPDVLAAAGSHWIQNAEDDAEFEKGLDSLRQALILNVDDPSTYLQLGTTELVYWDPLAAESNLTRALTLDEENGFALTALGDLYSQKEKYTTAITMYQRALDLEDDEVSAMANLGMGVAYSLQGETARAIEFLEKAREQEVENPMVYLYLARAYRDNEEYKKSSEALTEFIENAPEDFDVSILAMSADALKTNNYWFTESEALLISRLIVGEVAAAYEDAADLRLVSVDVEEDENELGTLVMTVQIRDEEVDERDVLRISSDLFNMGMLISSRVKKGMEGGARVVVRDFRNKDWIELEASRQVVLDRMDGLMDAEDLLRSITLRVLNRPTVSAFQDEVLDEVFQRVEDDRALEGKQNISSHFITTDTLRTHLQADYDANQEEQDASQHMMVLLGLLEPDVDMEKVTIDMETENIAGYYDPRRDTFFVITNDRSRFFNVDNEVTIAHEYVHALQDQYRGLDELGDQEMNDDQQLAFRALVEGEAMQVTLKYIEEHLTLLEQTRVFGMDRPQQLARAEGETAEDEEEDDTPPLVEHFESFPYVTGMKFVDDQAAGGYWPAIDKIYANPPASTEQVLHPEKYLGEERDDPQEVSLPDDLSAAKLGEGWEELDNNVMGEYFTREYLAGHVSPDLAVVGAAGWDGDRYAYYEDGKGKNRVMVWKTIWDSSEEAREFVVANRLAFGETEAYTETVRELHGTDRTLRWESEDRVVYLRQQGDLTWLVFATQAADLDRVLPLLEPEWK